jgi:hypothetical protein
MPLVISPSLSFRMEVQRHQIRAKQASGRVSSKANQMVAGHHLGAARFGKSS